MKANYTEKIKQLLENKISSAEERERLITEIRNNKELKLEFALMMKLKQREHRSMKERLRERAKQNMSHGESIAAGWLDGLTQAAFFKSTMDEGLEDLPIDEDTIENFLSEEEDDE